MKTIAIILAILATAAAQNMSAHLTLGSDSIGDRGVVNFFQNAANASVDATSCETRDLNPGRYYGIVHANQHSENNFPCFDTNNHRLFVAFTIKVTRYHQKFYPSERVTLFPGYSNSIGNREIGLYDSLDMARCLVGHIPHIAYGIVYLKTDESP